MDTEGGGTTVAYLYLPINSSFKSHKISECDVTRALRFPVHIGEDQNISPIGDEK